MVGERGSVGMKGATGEIGPEGPAGAPGMVSSLRKSLHMYVCIYDTKRFHKQKVVY